MHSLGPHQVNGFDDLFDPDDLRKFREVQAKMPPGTEPKTIPVRMKGEPPVTPEQRAQMRVQAGLYAHMFKPTK